MTPKDYNTVFNDFKDNHMLEVGGITGLMA